MEEGTLEVLIRELRVLAQDVKVLVESDIYKERLRECLIYHYDQHVLAAFLNLDNIFRDLCTVIGEEGTATLWDARNRVFEEVWRIVEGISSSGGRDWIAESAHDDRVRLRDVLLNVLSKRTPDDVYEHIEIGLK